MATGQYSEWLARGRTYQREGNPVDAMLWYRRAARANSAASEVHFHLGEVLWQMGRPADAIASWREGLRLDAQFMAPAQALSEALLALGDLPGAHDAAQRVLRLAPREIRASVVAGITALMLKSGDPMTAATLVIDALARDGTLATIPTLAGPITLAVDGLPQSSVKTTLLDCMERLPASSSVAALPALWLALVCEHERPSEHDAPHGRAALFAGANARDYALSEHDALRRIALAAARAATADARALAGRYARLCATTFAPPVPLLWPGRTQGLRLRVVVLHRATPTGPEADALAMLRRLPADEFDVVTAALGDAPTDDAQAPGTTAAVPSLIVLPPVPDAHDAKRIALRDPDVLIDLIGLAASTGPLLAQRPARLIMASSDFAASNDAPLIDRADVSTGDLARVLGDLRRALPDSTATPEAGAMTAIWEEAVRTHQQGDLAAAREHYANVLALQPGHASAHYLLGVALRDGGDLDRAREAFDAAIVAAPGFVDARIAAAKAAQAAGEPRLAASLCAAGFATTREHLRLLREIGQALLAARDGAGATEAFTAALGFDVTDGETHYNQGVALQMQHRLADAARSYQRALAFRPDLVAADFNLGALFQVQGATDAAVAAYANVLSVEPANAAAYKNLGEALFGAGRIDAWLTNFRRFETHCPTALALAVQALEACQYQGDFAGVDRYLDGLRAERFLPEGEVDLCDNLEQLLYLLLFFDIEPATILRFAQTYDATARRVYGTPLARSGERRAGPLRVGYLSADLRNHVMGKMMWQAVRHHDRARFSLHFYSLSTLSDEWTQRFIGIANRFEVVAGLDEHEAALRIQKDDLDLLIDLSTHTKGAKPGILALKPARVILTHVASAGTLGLSAVDFKLTDRYADVPENQAYQIETLLPIDGCIYPYRHIEPAATHTFHRATLGLAADSVLIGAFVAPLKLSRRCLRLWHEVLQRIPRAVLVFSPTNPAFRDSYLRITGKAGIAPNRIFFLPQGTDDATNQARYGLIDFVLDPLPFGGANGTLEALDMGVPVVTLVGKRHGERVAYSILSNLGVTQTIAEGGREYVDLAVRLADDAAFAAEVRAAIRTGLARSALTDSVGHTRALEAAYLRALAAKAPDVLPSVGESSA